MFATFTQDLNQLADWLQQCKVRTVAMESTGVYWIPLMQILEARGWRSILSTRSTSRMFRADAPMFPTASGCSTCILLVCCGHRSVQRRMSALSARYYGIGIAWSRWRLAHVQHIQKALDQMNLQLHHVISDITGTTGLAIIDAILDGNARRMRWPRSVILEFEPAMRRSRKVWSAITGESICSPCGNPSICTASIRNESPPARKRCRG